MAQAGWIFIDAMAVGVLSYLTYIFVSDWRATRAFWREQDKRQHEKRYQ